MDEDLLVVYAGHEADVLRDHPGIPYPDALREAFRRSGSTLGYPVTGAEADALDTSVPDCPAFDDSAEVCGG